MNDEFKSIATTTCIDTCNGICKRVLKDIEQFSKEELLKAYISDIYQGGRDYLAIIELGTILKELNENYKTKVQ